MTIDQKIREGFQATNDRLASLLARIQVLEAAGGGGSGGGHKYVLEDTGRVYLYNDERWITPYDDIYGWGYYQNAENSGTSVDPLQEWEHMGRYVRAGTICHNLTIIGRITDANNQIDMEIYAGFRAPNPISRWDITGFDNDSEHTFTQLFRDKWITPTNLPLKYPLATGAVNDQYRRSVDLDGFVAPSDGWLMAYFKPISNPAGDTANDYFYSVRNWLLEHPA